MGLSEPSEKRARSSPLAPEGPGAAPPPRATAAELAALKLALCGESIVDAARLLFADVAAVDAFLRLSAFDTDNPLDLARLHELHHEATVYLTDVHRYRLPLQIEQPPGIHDVFLAAGRPALGRVQRFACMTLKVMHIMHHISGRELLFNTPISEAQLFDRLNSRVFTMMDRLRAAGVGVHEFTSGKKSKTSLATKLLAKRNNLATQIFDKLRFRVVVNSRNDLVMAVLFLLRHLVPFNYILPEQSQNNILGATDVARALDLDAAAVAEAWAAPSAAPIPVVRPTPNEFSASDYRCVSFVGEIPMRIDDVAPQATPAIAFVQAEVQLVDLESARANERGESSHALYKKRQRARVRARLEGSELAARAADAVAQAGLQRP